MRFPILATQLVGSYTKPNWLYRREALMKRDFDHIWEPDAAVAGAARDDAVRLAVRDQERAGLDIVTDGEQRRASFVNHFYRFGGIDAGTWAPAVRRNEGPIDYLDVSPEAAMARGPMLVPRVTGPITWPGPMALDDLCLLKSLSRRPVKMTVVGPVTAACRLVDEHYGDERTFALALADAINKELRALDAEGVDVLQIDEPDVHMRSARTAGYAAEAIDRALDGIRSSTVVHLCYGYSVAMKQKRVDVHFGEVLNAMANTRVDAINLEYEEPGHTPEILEYCGKKRVVLGLLNLGSSEVESPIYIASRIREALDVVPPDRLMLAPDCGMWFLRRPVAFGKIRSLSVASQIVRDELAKKSLAS